MLNQLQINRFLLATIYIIPIIFWAILFFGFQFNGLYGQDSHIYLQYSESISQFFATGTHPGDYYWSIYYPLSGAILGFVTANNAIALQLVSLIAFIALIHYLHKILHLFYPAHSFSVHLYLLFAVTLSPFLLRASVFVMSDMLAIALTIAAIYYMLHYYQQGELKSFVLLVLLSGLAVLTRYQMAILLAIPAFLVLSRLFETRKIEYIGLGLFILLLCFCPYVWAKTDQSLAFLGNTYLNDWSFINVFKSSFYTADGFAQHKITNLLFVSTVLLHPGFIFFGILILPFFKEKDIRDTEKWVLLAAFIFYLIFLAGIPFQSHRVLTPAYPLGVLLLFPAFRRALTFIDEVFLNSNNRYPPDHNWKSLTQFFQTIRLRQLMLGVGGITLVLLNIHVMKKFLHLHQFEKETTAKIATFQDQTVEKQRVYTLGFEGPLYSYTDYEVMSLWKESGKNMPKNSLIFINEINTQQQYQEHELVKRLQSIHKNYPLEELESFEDGWQLYKIQ